MPETTSDLAPAAVLKNPFDTLKGGQNAGSIIPGKTKNYALAIVGKQKSGKSWLATSHTKDPLTGEPMYTWVADFDNRSESLAGKSNAYVVTLTDQNQLYPEAITKLEIALEDFKYKKLKNELIPDIFVLDTITFMEKWLQNEIIKQSKTKNLESKMYRQFGSQGRPILISSGWDMINCVRRYLEYFIAEFRTLGNLICVFHERPEKDPMHSTKDNIVFTGQYGVDPYYLNTLLSVFSEVMRITSDSYGGYKVITKMSPEFNGATTWNIDKEERPDLAAMLEKHFKNNNISTK